MGCDIHLFVEYRRKENGATWLPFGKEFRLARDYEMFGRMAKGVRREPENGFAPRGVPSDMSWSAEHEHLMFIHDGEREESNYVTTADAAKYVASGESQYVTKYGKDKPNYVTHPDWHSHSWLTRLEFVKCIEHADYPAPDYKAVAAAMRSLENDGLETRVVFWFDN